MLITIIMALARVVPRVGAPNSVPFSDLRDLKDLKDLRDLILGSSFESTETLEVTFFQKKIKILILRAELT